MTALASTNDGGFWRSICKREMGWLWEALQDLDVEPAQINWKHVCMLADSKTCRPWGMHDEYMSLANRRRIWGVCKQIAPHYLRQQPESDSSRSPILDNAITLQMPLVSFPPPEKSRPFTTVIDTWPMRASQTTLSIGWNNENELSDISLHGLPDKAHAHTTLISIQDGDWIESLTLFLRDMDILKYLDPSPPSVAVLGVKLRTCRGHVHEDGDVSSNLNRRYMAPSEGRAMVGFVGRVDEERACVSILTMSEMHESAASGGQPLPNATMPEVFRYLWAPKSVLLPEVRSGYRGDKMHEIWRHPTITMEVPRKSSFEDYSLSKDLIPMQVILYNERDVTGIEAMLAPDGTVTDAHGNVTKYIKKIIGIRVCLASGDMQPWSTVGSLPHPEYKEHKKQNLISWESRDYVERFDIDGANGEALDMVATEVSQGLQAIRFRTNHGREVEFGHGSGNNWWEAQDFSSADRPRIVGFACGFGTASGHVWLDARQNKKMKTLVSLTCITALTIKR